jgi:3-phosphoshikimate 1-carboxyvinyltransferase
MFKFEGTVAASKSWMNRALVIQHFNKKIEIIGKAYSEDVTSLNEAIAKIGSSASFHLGHGGTTLRFFSYLISRHPGNWLLKAEQRLLERPQAELILILTQLGVVVHLEKDQVRIESEGWKIPDVVVCNGATSSQFVSGLLLSSWNLEKDLVVQIKKPVVSIDYLKMTLQLLQVAGMQMSMNESSDDIEIVIPKAQKPLSNKLHAELDISSAFALIAAAVIDGEVKITNWNNHSTQPDIAFLEIFKKMNISFELTEVYFKIQKHDTWRSCAQNLNSAPDLFPVLSILCALAKGQSKLFGAQQLKFKESNRILKTQELLDLVGYKAEVLEDGLTIEGQSSTTAKQKSLKFSPDQDHRMAMAAGLLKLYGYNIQIETPAVINKSYPQFYQDIGVTP